MSDTLGGSSIAKTTTALLFVVGACFGLVQSIPILLNANAAADRIARWRPRWRPPSSRASRSCSSRRSVSSVSTCITWCSATSTNSPTPHSGSVPIDFSLRSGELIFITGGNGSGKSTFLRVLSGLYPPDSGDFTLDGRPVNNASRDEYRGLMSAIFFDYHLFQRLYGVADADPAEIDRLLAKFRLTGKTSLVNGEFRTLDLSGGQRRRLALIVSMLEKRPIMILDEWTAEQDPEFRRKFYDELLPELMQAGATCVVITHDDRYLDELHLPARRIRMDEGRIVEEHTMG